MRNTIYGLLVALGLPFCTTALYAEDNMTGFVQRVHKGADGTAAKYVVYVPHDYRGDRPYPLILFLHGAGEWGLEGEKQVAVGIGPAIRKQQKTFPFLVLLPQSQKKTWPIDLNNREQLRDILGNWSATKPEGKRVLTMLDEVMKDYRVDPTRIYLTGLSMGGYGTWSLAASHPEKWAAIVPICGGGNPKMADKIKHLPCWCFHGDADTAVPVQRSREMMKALWAAGGHPNYTEYPGVGHNSWDHAYGTPDLYEWLLRQRLKKP